MAGLLRSLTDRFQPTPLSMGLINAGANMMMAGGPSRMPTNLGSTLGAGLQGLLQGYSIENESQADRAYQAEQMKRQEKQDELEYQIKEMQLKNNGMSKGTPGQWYFPPGSKEETFGGVKGARTPDGAFIPFRNALTEYQAIMTNPEQQAAIARARSAATEGEKIVNVPMGQEGAPAFIKQGDLTQSQSGLLTNVGNMRPQGANTGFQTKVPVQQDLQRMDKNLQAYGNKGIGTIRGVISRWSPPNENNTEELIARAAKVLSVGPDDPIDLSDHMTRARLMDTITLQEGTNKQLFPRPQTEAQKEQLKADIEVKKAGDKKIAEAAAEKKAESPNKLRLIRNRLAEIEEGIKALQPSDETDKLSGSPKKFGFEAGGFMGGSGIVPSAYFDITNNPNYRTLQRVSSSEELQRAVDDMAKQGAITEPERQILRLGVGFDPSSNRSSQIYNQLVKSRDRIKELYKQLGGEDIPENYKQASPDVSGLSDEELDARLEQLMKGR